ncbi:MAG: aminotransferase class I/II-fold pyridoxal phosphate-dependent enzyme [Spirochaetes bacterium]|nr:aminotransferase class I/II-fold pyridoxal phosphate-dependent enzyme [Spirochaetota bacterium]
MKLKLVQQNSPETLVSRTGSAVPPSGIREFFDIVYSTPDCISLGVGEPDFTTPWRISDSGIFAIKDGNTHYTPNRGLPELRDLISRYLAKEYDLAFDPDTELIVTLGVSQGLDLALRSIINPGDEVIIFEPCYVSYTANVMLLHGTPVVIPTYYRDRFKIDIDLFKKAITPKTKAVILSYPSNPTGATIDRETLEAIAELSIRHNFIVISDEIYCSLAYEGRHFSIATIPDMKTRTIYLNGFSKSHAMTGWRLGYVAGPQYISDIMMKIHQYTALCASSIAQYAAIEAITKGAKDVLQMKNEYIKRRNFICSRLNEIGLKCLVPEGAFYVFPDVSATGLNGRDFALGLLQKEKVAVVPGRAFGECGEYNVRCSYATSMDNIRESMLRIERYVKQL